MAVYYSYAKSDSTDHKAYLWLREKHIGRIQQLCLMDDDFMSKVLEDHACAEIVLRAILAKDDLTVHQVQTQYEIKNLQGRSVRLDVFAADAQNTRYNIEVQRLDTGAIPQRAHYNRSLIDANITLPSDDLKQLPHSYVIFITEHDVLKDGKAIYTIDRMIRESGKEFGDGSHIVYVNGTHRGDDAIGTLMHDFFCKSAGEMLNNTLANRVRYFKEDEEGVGNMCKIMENIRREGRKESRIKVRRERVGAMETSCPCPRQAYISIHAPRAGSDFDSRKEARRFDISIHAPRAGSDLTC